MIRHNTKGFTLIETIYAIAILGILSIALTNMIMLTINTHKNSKEQFNATLLAQYHFEKIKASDVAEAENIKIESGNLHIEIDIAEVEKYKDRLFKVTVEVMNGDKSLEKIEGYKLMCLQEMQREGDSKE